MVGQIAASIPGIKVHDADALELAPTGSVAGDARRSTPQGDADKVTGTPTLFVGKTGTKGKPSSPSRAPTDEQAVVDAALDAALNPSYARK